MCTWLLVLHGGSLFGGPASRSIVSTGTLRTRNMKAQRIEVGFVNVDALLAIISSESTSLLGKKAHDVALALSSRFLCTAGAGCCLLWSRFGFHFVL